MRFFTKLLTTPKINETKQVDAVQLWTVTWWSRVGKYHGDVEKRYEAFTSEAGANEFAESLRAAFKLLGHTDMTEVEVNEN